MHNMQHHYKTTSTLVRGCCGNGPRELWLASEGLVVTRRLLASRAAASATVRGGVAVVKMVIGRFSSISIRRCVSIGVAIGGVADAVLGFYVVAVTHR